MSCSCCKNKDAVTKQGEKGIQGPIGPPGPIGPSGVSKKSFEFSASRNNSNSTLIFLSSSDGSPTNKSPQLITFPATITDISATTNSVETWLAEIRVDNGSGFNVVSSLNLSATDGDSSVISVPLNIGDKVALYCNGSGIDTPSIKVIIVED